MCAKANGFVQIGLPNACRQFYTLPKFAKRAGGSRMTTMNISLPEGLKAFVDERVHADDYGSSSEYVLN